MQSLLARLAILTTLGIVLAAPQATAQEAYSDTNYISRQVEMQGLAGDVSTLQSKVDKATARLFKIKECHTAGKLFRTLDDGNEGCKDVVPPQVSEPGSADYTTPGIYSFTVPTYATLTVQVWGAGGGAGAVNYVNGNNGRSGGSSSFEAVYAGGGAGSVAPPNTIGSWGAGGTGGAASGGDVNLSGGNGATAINSTLGITSGGASPNGGSSNSASPGAGAKGSTSNKFGSGGGGGGAYASKTYTPGGLVVGSIVTVNVGAGGTSGGGTLPSPAGAAGRVFIQWQ